MNLWNYVKSWLRCLFFSFSKRVRFHFVADSSISYKAWGHSKKNRRGEWAVHLWTDDMCTCNNCKKKKKNLNPLVKPKLQKLVSDKEWEKEFKLQREKIFVCRLDGQCLLNNF